MSRNEVVTDEFITLGAAQEVTGLTASAIRLAARRGEIATIAGRGERTVYRRSDILKFAGILK